MAHVRSIEQQYWALSQQQVALWSRETAVKIGEEILKREKAELEAGRATTADVAEAEQQLENFKLNLVTATSDVITDRAAAPEHPRPARGRRPPDRRRHGRRPRPRSSPTGRPASPACSTRSPRSPSNASSSSMARVPGRPLKATTRALADPDRARRQAGELRAGAGLPPAGHPPGHALAGPVLPRDRCQLQAVPDRPAAPGRRPGSPRSPSEPSTRKGRITVDRLLDAVGQHANAGRAGGPVQVPATTPRSPPWRRPRGPSWPTTGSSSPTHASPKKPTPRPRDDRVAPAAFQEPAPAPPRSRLPPGPARRDHLQAPGQTRRHPDLGDRARDQPGPARRPGPMTEEVPPRVAGPGSCGPTSVP